MRGNPFVMSPITPPLRLVILCFLGSGAIWVLGCHIYQAPPEADLQVATQEKTIPLDLVGKRTEGIYEFMAMMGYTSTLEIKADGTFEKIESEGPIDHETIETYRGICRRLKDGTIEFHLTSKTTTPATLRAQGKEGETTSLDVVFWCRCALDSAGFLVIDHFQTEPSTEYSFTKNDTGLEWRTCYPARE